jgi:hypothetical protein
MLASNFNGYKKSNWFDFWATPHNTLRLRHTGIGLHNVYICTSIEGGVVLFLPLIPLCVPCTIFPWKASKKRLQVILSVTCDSKHSAPPRLQETLALWCKTNENCCESWHFHSYNETKLYFAFLQQLMTITLAVSVVAVTYGGVLILNCWSEPTQSYERAESSICLWQCFMCRYVRVSFVERSSLSLRSNNTLKC